MSNKSNKSSKAAKPQTTSTKATKVVKVENPYRQGGGYWATVEALNTLGLGKMHSFEKIVPAVKKAMGDSFKAFAAKKGKLTADERIILNVAVTARQDYGEVLRKLGVEVRFDGRKHEAGIFKIGSK